MVHNGNLYTGCFDGRVHALDLAKGNIVWTSDYIGTEYESIYGNQPLTGYFIGAGADGNLHFASSTIYGLMPRTRFHVLVYIDKTTGHFLWKLSIGVSPTSIADGYLVGVDDDNGMQYCKVT